MILEKLDHDLSYLLKLIVSKFGSNTQIGI